MHVNCLWGKKTKDFCWNGHHQKKIHLYIHTCLTTISSICIYLRWLPICRPRNIRESFPWCLLIRHSIINWVKDLFEECCCTSFMSVFNIKNHWSKQWRPSPCNYPVYTMLTHGSHGNPLCPQSGSIILTQLWPNTTSVNNVVDWRRQTGWSLSKKKFIFFLWNESSDNMEINSIRNIDQKTCFLSHSTFTGLCCKSEFPAEMEDIARQIVA